MPANLTAIRRCLRQFDFRTLFIQELGWDRPAGGLSVAVDGRTFALRPIAEKRGFQVFECPANGDGAVPDYATRGKIQRQTAKLAHEHIIVYTDAARTAQKWQWVRRELGRPLARREYDFGKGQTGELLAQKLQDLAVDLGEEEDLTLIDVTRRARKAFDVERVTKRFYDRFQTEHAAFLAFLRGVQTAGDAEWYASLMLNRLMFIYFIQKKGFLDGDADYLRNRLQQVRALKGKDKFLTFYRTFLLRLFHEGLGQQPKQRKKDLEALLGQVPYLNGGLFDVHALERTYPDIQIADEAFARLFDFFDAYRWHLDERPLRADNEINPDVLGYIFEKYINQKQMGAYYTKEDVTGYIARNTILPFLFNAAEKHCAIAFQSGSALWRLLGDDPDRYIHAAMRKGVDLPLPRARSAKQGREGGSPLLGAAGWNTPAAPEYGLPTETWREYVARRQRCHELRARLKAGEIHDINDLISCNLDIGQFAEDAIANCEGPELLRAFYRALEKASVLDPTCGSGAFLFAALNILEPLYEACLDRMAGFLEDMRRLDNARRLDQFGDFHQVLNEAARHPNRRYFILKSIIVNNLYGVDVMEEAVEICKLRLFLKLVAQVESAEQIEPLPDIDFNVRAGNTLVGFASLAELEALQKTRLGFDAGEVKAVQDRAKDVEEKFTVFRRLQMEFGDSVDFSEEKKRLQAGLTALRNQLDRYLAGEYGVDPDKPEDFRQWRDSHEPFHWLAEFYGIMSGGGFDVIIGNPPYVEYKNVRDTYQVRGFSTEECGDLYAYVMERSGHLLKEDGRFGMIVPVSISSTDGFQSLRTTLYRTAKTSWCSSFADRPSKLFTGVEKRLTIWLMARRGTAGYFVSRYHRWLAEERVHLFSTMRYAAVGDLHPLVGSSIAKIGRHIEREILRKISSESPLRSFWTRQNLHVVYYTRKVRYFVQFFDFVPQIHDAKGKLVQPSELKTISLSSPEEQYVVLAVLNSGLFFWFFNAYSDVRNVNRREIDAFPCSIEKMRPSLSAQIRRLAIALMEDFRSNAKTLTNDYGKHGVLRIQTFQPRLSKPILDEIDAVLAKHYGFTDEELDFIVNYDVKYRMGQDGEADDE